MKSLRGILSLINVCSSPLRPIREFVPTAQRRPCRQSRPALLAQRSGRATILPACGSPRRRQADSTSKPAGLHGREAEPSYRPCKSDSRDESWSNGGAEEGDEQAAVESPAESGPASPARKPVAAATAVDSAAFRATEATASAAEAATPKEWTTRTERKSGGRRRRRRLRRKIQPAHGRCVHGPRGINATI